MKRALLLLAVAVGGCYSQTSSQPVPAAIVNDACGANGSQATCAVGAGCEWRAVKSECPAGTACPDGVCVTPDACAGLADRERCEADTRCAWSGLRLASASIDLCPVGQSCEAGGYCHARDASGGGCTCVQPIACPANAACPAVQCDCSNPPPGTGAGGGGGTCTCTCPTCAPGQACPPCTCDCASGGGGSCGGGATGGGTCTCACPTCGPDATCPPCDCACGSGNVGVTTTTMVGPPSPAGATVDPCTPHGDASACTADGANACGWIELGIVCVTTPCPSGACVQVKPVPDGGAAGCGCACPACIGGQSCPPCACNCCGRGADLPPTPEPVPPSG